jgi:GNAT superfamily N-acetyltransferase
MHIRIATESDIQAMHRVRLSVRENRLGDPARIQPRHYLEMLSSRGRGWVAEVQEQVIGFGIADLEGSNIWPLFVDPQFERRGVGKQLRDSMTEWMFASGAEIVWLSTDPQTRAEAFYSSAGWRLTGREPNGETRFEMSRQDWLSRAERT